MISFLVVLIAIIGVISALVALDSFDKEAKVVGYLEKELERKLVVGDLDEPRLRPNDLLGPNRGQIKGLVGRRVSAISLSHKNRCKIYLPDLQALSATYESGLLSIKLARGIAGVLLIIGIAGTLLAIKPVLGGFTLVPEDSTSVALGPELIENSQTLIRSLGTAFHPSLWALGGTILMVGVLGVCHHKAGQLARDLDQFTVELLLPYYRLPEIGDDLKFVGTSFENLIKSVQKRDNGLETVIADMQKLVDSMSSTTTDLKGSVDALSGSLKLFPGVLEKKLGDKSPLVKKIDGLTSEMQTAASAFDSSKQAAESFSKDLKASTEVLTKLPGELDSKVRTAINDLTRTAQETAEALEGAVQPVVTKIEKVNAQLTAHMYVSTKAVTEIKDAALKKIQEAPLPLEGLGQVMVDLKVTSEGLSEVKQDLLQVLPMLDNKAASAAEEIGNAASNAVDRVSRQSGDVLKNLEILVSKNAGRKNGWLTSWWTRAKSIFSK